jgi:4-hydroxy-tetrahydrodipicolinate reductase
MRAVRVLHVGLGPIGAAAARLVATRAGLRIVGGVDPSPAMTGRDVGDLVGLGRRLGLAVGRDLPRALRATKPDVVVHCTSSSLARVMPEVEVVLRSKAAIVSTTEELSYPYLAHPKQARTIDRWAKRAGVAVLGTGVNPGFALDVLPIALTAACERVDGVRVDRLQDARIRRRSFQEKIGAGLTVREFHAGVREGRLRHVGLTESMAMIADACGFALDRVVDRIRPKVAEEGVSSRFFRVAPGRVSGIVQDGFGYVNGQPVIRLHMEAYLGAPDTCDVIAIRGIPSLDMRIAKGIHGDLATPALVVNAVPRVLEAPPGLRSMRDLSLPSFFPGFPGFPGVPRAPRPSGGGR